jgi:hypothetical protein
MKMKSIMVQNKRLKCDRVARKLIERKTSGAHIHELDWIRLWVDVRTFFTIIQTFYFLNKNSETFDVP